VKRLKVTEAGRYQSVCILVVSLDRPSLQLHCLMTAGKIWLLPHQQTCWQ